MSAEEGVSGGAEQWWADVVGYEVYLRSFADGDGDGVGDLRGLHDRLDYLAWLGIGAVWITPFYPSPMRDHGYDVADYRDVDPEYGTLADFDALVAKAHELGLRVVLDLVPNHTSSDHQWFAEARSSRENPHRDFYLWRDPAPDGGPPNNWLSHFGGPAWTLDEASGQYWCHLFLPEQPDLNWRNADVAERFDEILRFWLGRGADGFRIDVAHALIKHPDFPDLPAAQVGADEQESHAAIEHAAIVGAAIVGDGIVRDAIAHVRDYERLEHIYDVDQPENTEIFRRWRKTAEPANGLLLGEVYLLEAELLQRYISADDGLNLAFWFAPLHCRWDADELREVLVAGASLPTGRVAWVQSSHDRPRSATRFGGGARGQAHQLALATLLLGMPGVPFVYQGEELGLEDGKIPALQAQDPIAAWGGDHEHSRDGCRTPMLWEPGDGWGFTTADTPWLPYGQREEGDTVAMQREDPDSVLNRYRSLIRLRNELQDLRGASLEWVTNAGPVIAYRRGEVLVAANCGSEQADLWLPPGPWMVTFGTVRDREETIATSRAALAPNEGLILLPNDPSSD